MIDENDRDRRYIKNRRSNSLLNVDLKIASKALALYVKSNLNMALAVSALWWLTESSSIYAYFL